MTAQSRAWVWQFGDATLDGAALELRVAGAPVPIEPKALELLMELLRHPGEVVTKDELLDAVWPGRVVTEGVLVKAVAKVRAAIGDADGQVVRTVHGYGYRLVAEVKLLAPARAAPASSQLDLAPGSIVPGRANWHLLRPLGDGGQGEVWLGEQGKTRERRVFKFARDGAGLAALKREITLSRLLRDSLGERADLVPVLDWNLDEPPYFLESAWSPAGSLLDWDTAIGGIATVPLAQRLDLAAEVGDALAAAHGVGVLHKDIKPGNVLVELEADGTPRARLGDFGSGRLLDPGQLEALGITRMGYTRTVADATGPTSGTPLYTAPEVLAGQAPTTRSDVYALGVLAWQLAVGDLRRPLAPGWERALDDEVLREDIAACVDGDPVRRLADPSELARRLRTLDVRRQARQAVQASAERLENAQRQAERFRRKRQVALIVAAAAVAALAVSLWFFADARRAERQAAEAASRAQAVNEFLVRDLLGSGDPYVSGGGEQSIAAALQRAESGLDRRFPGQPRLDAAVRLTLASAFVGMGDSERAAAQLVAARERLSEQAASDDPLQDELRVIEAKVFIERNEFDRARAVLADIDVDALTPSAPALAFERAALAAYLMQLTQPPEQALALLDRLLPRFRARFGDASEELQSVARSRAEALERNGQLEAALAEYQALHAQSEALYGADDLRTAKYLRSAASAQYRLGRFEGALATSRRALDILTAHLGEAHLHTLEAQGDVATNATALGRLDDADAMNARALAAARARLGPTHNLIVTLLNGRSMIEHGRGRLDAAIVASQEAHAQSIALYGEDHVTSLQVGHNLARLMQEAGRWDDAERLQQALLEIAPATFADDHWQLAQLRAAYGVSLLRHDDPEPGLAMLARGLADLEATVGPDHPHVVRYRGIQAQYQQPAGSGDRP
jgi:DNA-binding winged helix-turn-helix (wHTH) protein/tetratricopeptide (TPR) repeat protein